jgi:regulation of enolase protein 1 (concanavalin A-like superfamily)
MSVLGALPAPWQHRDVGAVALPGSAGYATNVFTIQTSGDGITNQTDSFHFVYQTLTGDGQITARVRGLDYTGAFAQAGVMVRETVAAGSSYAFMALAPTHLAGFRWRAGTGQASGQGTLNSMGSGEYWMRLVRTGDTLTGYYSTNAQNWMQSGSISIAMQKSVLIGLASTANNNATLNTSTFSQVQFVPSVSFVQVINGLQVWWPTNFVLQATSNLLASNLWIDFPATPAVSNSQATLSISATNRQQFFRLRDGP